MTTYTLTDTDLFLDVLPKERQYILRVRDLAPNEKPREKLIAHGPSALTIQELLAVVLNVGTKREGILQMSSRLIKEYGEKGFTTYTNVKKLSLDLGVPITKAAQVVACAELGKRFYEKSGKRHALIRTPKDAYEHLKEMATLPKEHLRGIYLNAERRIIHDEIVSIGTVNSNMVHPREVFRPAIEYGAVAVLLAHNHPSGNEGPSQADIDVTRQIAEAGKMLGIELLDHIVITQKTFTRIDF
ncbi:MAG: DNA repair protein RadC [Patescibacteria group bacterium]